MEQANCPGHKAVTSFGNSRRHTREDGVVEPITFSKLLSEDSPQTDMEESVVLPSSSVNMRLNFRIVSTESSWDPVSKPVDVRIASRGDLNLFMQASAASSSHRRPTMAHVQPSHLADVVFEMRQWILGDIGRTVCTFLHEPTNLFLAVDERSHEPILQGGKGSTTCTTSSSIPLGCHPVPSSSYDVPDSVDPDRCCFFEVSHLNQPTYLRPEVCPGTSLVYDKAGDLSIVDDPRAVRCDFQLI